MKKTIIAIVVAAALMNSFYGCTCCTKIKAHEVQKQPEGKIEKVVLNSGELIEFDDDGARIDPEKKMVKGYLADEAYYGQVYEAKFTDVREVHYRRISTEKSIIAVAVTGGLVIAAFTLIESLNF